MNHAGKFAILHGGSLRDDACIFICVGTFNEPFVVATTSLFLFSVDHSDCGAVRRDGRVLMYGVHRQGVLRACSVRLFGMMSIMWVFCLGVANL